MQENKLIILKELVLLLVEDDEKLLKNLKMTLSLFFKDIKTANNGSSALEIYKKSEIDVVITDYVMPIMSGYDLCAAIREINKKVPILIMSNFTDQEKLLNAIPLNLSDYLVKPIEYTVLIQSLLKIIQNMEENNLLNENITNTIKYNVLTKVLINNDEIITLTKSEIKILELFIKNKNKLVNTHTISLCINENDYKSTQAIKNIIHRLRKKLTKDSILNIQGLGYILKIEEEI